MCNDGMPVSVKVYYGQPSASAVEIRRFVFRPEQQQKGRPGAPSSIFQALVERIRSVFNGLNLHDLHLCWKGEIFEHQDAPPETFEGLPLWHDDSGMFLRGILRKGP